MHVRQFTTGKHKTAGTRHLTEIPDNKGRITSLGLIRPIGEYNNSTAKYDWSA